MFRKALLPALTYLLCGAGLVGQAWAAGGPSVDANGVVTIHPGEKVAIKFASESDISHPVLVSDASGPSTMSFKLEQLDGAGLMLMIENHLGITVKYDATIVVNTPDGERSAHTSSCPVLAGLMGTESWMDPIVELKLSGFRKADPDQRVCD